MKKVIATWLLMVVGVVTLAAPAAAQYTRWQYPQQYSISPTGVNLQTGRFISSNTDLAIGDVKFVRNWGDVPSVTVSNRSFGVLGLYSESMVTTWAPNNNGWTNSFNQGVRYSLGVDPRYFVVADGKTYQFRGLLDAAIVPVGMASSGTMLALVNGQWNFTDRSGNLYVYFAHPAMPQGGATGNPNQLIQSIIYANGSRLDFAYSAAGRPKWVSSSSGFAIKLEYNAVGNVSAACGFNLAASFASVATSCTASALRVSYRYDAAGNTLTAFVDTLGQVTTMTYSNWQSQHYFPTCISLPNSATCRVRNVFGRLPADTGFPADLDQVRQQTTANGEVWTYNYQPQPDPSDLPIVLGMPRYSRAAMTDPLGGTYSLRFDRGRLVTQGTPEGTRQFLYKYVQLKSGKYWDHAALPPDVEYFAEAPGLVIMPEGNMEYYGHDNRGNLIMRSSWSKGAANPLFPGDVNWRNCCLSLGQPAPPAGSVTTTRTYLEDVGVIMESDAVIVLGCGSGAADAKLCDKPFSETDPNGNRTDYTYAQAHGGVLTETGPAVDGVRPQTRSNYTHRYAWTRNSAGAFVRSAAGVWLLTQKSTCISGSAAASGTGCAVAGDEVVTTYDYGPDSGPNNLLLRGMAVTSGGQTLRTCYGYDGFGRKISETAPRAGLAACP